jgi:signal transduction histidine kinase/ligand-binding sensor domain-containing protein/DNA-binding response OmpR family regulator
MMSFKRISLIPLLLFITGITIYAQEEKFRFHHLQTTTGLSQNDVISLFQDSRGFMWIGTNDGLNRYDGYSFRVFQYEPDNIFSLTSNLISCIDEDFEGNLWIGTSDGHICMFDRKLEIFNSFRQIVPILSSLPNWSINAINVENDNKIWAGTSTGLYLLYSEEPKRHPNRVKHFSSFSMGSQSSGTDAIHCLVTDQSDDLWIGASSGLYLRNRPSPLDMPWDATFRKIQKEGSNIAFSILPLDNYFLVAFEDGLYSFDRIELDKEKPSFKKVSDGQFRYISQDDENRIWAGSRKGVLVISICPDNKEIISSSWILHDPDDSEGLSSDIVRSMRVSSEGSVWIGTRGGGVNIYSPKTETLFHHTVNQNPGSIPQKRVVGLFNDISGNIWIGTEGGGLSVLPIERRADYNSGFIHLDDQKHSATIMPVSFTEWCYNGKDTAIFYGQGGGIASGLGKVRLIGEKIEHEVVLPELSYEFYALEVVGGNELWAGTYGQGIFCVVYDNSSEKFIVTKRLLSDIDKTGRLPSNVIRSILEDHYGNIWVGTSNGLSYLPKDEKEKQDPEFTKLNSGDGYIRGTSDNYVIPILESSDDLIWAGTLGGGLKVIHRTGEGKFEINRITTRDGLPNNSVKSIVEDHLGMIWISTNKGLTRLDPASKSIRNLGIDDGLQDLEFSEAVAASLPDGNLVFGGVNGLNVFNPEEMKDTPGEIPVLLTEFYILNQFVRTGEIINGRAVLPVAVPELREIELKYKENSFSIGFSDLQYFNTSKNLFRYRLLGFDDEWLMLGRNERSVRYTNVPKGKYTFQVSATDIDGNWEGTLIKELDLAILPPWYRSIAAYIFYWMFFVGFLLLFRRYTLVAVKEKNRYAMERFQNEQIEQLTQAKLSFFTNIAHEFRSPLSLIIGPLEKLIVSGKIMMDENRQHYYHLMQRNSHLMLRLIDQLMDFRRLEEKKMNRNISKIDLVEVLIEIMDVFNELAKSKSIQFNINLSSHECELWFDVDKLEKIFYNLLSNAFKNVNEEGYVKIEVADTSDSYPDYIEVRVLNSGKGIAKENLGRIFEQFTSFEDSRTIGTGGTGIGLSFTKTLIELHHGMITVKSTPDVVTCFTVFFKKGMNHFQKTEFSQSRNRSGSLEKIAYKHSSFFLQRKTTQLTDSKKDDQPRILVIEDNPELLYFISDQLSENFQVNTAMNGEEGMELCLKILPDLIVSDIIMPKMDGFEFCKKLKSDMRLNHIPLILLTSKSTESDQIAGLHVGAEAYVSKPFSVEVLEAQINSILMERKRLRSHFAQIMKVESSTEGLTSIDMKFLNRLTRLIDENLSEPGLSVKFIAAEFGMDQALLNKKLKALTDMTTNTFIRNYRLRKAASLIEKNRYFVLDVAYEVGFNDVKYFRQCFKNYFQMTPSEYAKNYKENNSD